VANGVVRDDFGVIVAEVRVGHAEGLKDIFGGVCAQRKAGDALHDETQERVAGVAVHMLVARLEVEVLLTGDDGHDVVIGDEILRVAPAGEAEKSPLVAEAAGVVYQVADSDALAEIGKLWNVFADIVIEVQLALLSQQEDGGSGKLLGHGSDVEDG